MPGIRRVELVLFGQSTALLELVVGVCGTMALGLVLLLTPMRLIPMEPTWGERVWGGLLVLAGLTQAGIVGSRAWRLRLWTTLFTAWALLVRLILTWSLTGVRAIEVVLYLSPFVVQLLLAWRVWQDWDVALASRERRGFGS